MNLDIKKEVSIERTLRVEMLGSMFDVPIEDKLSVSLSGSLSDLESRSWNIGLIVGPSGSGKSLTLNELFGKPKIYTWEKRSIIDDFSSDLSMEAIASVCSSVGFNTIPAWLRPFNVLSNGEQFRAEISRRLLDSNSNGPICIDEFTSVVDRQVAQITSHSVQKYVRSKGLKLVAASCHYDIIPWLQPDWILEPGDPLRFQWRELQSRPKLNVSISRVQYKAWDLFKKYHYINQDLNKAARCYGLFINDKIASFSSVLYRPHPRVSDIMGLSRSVTLPDFQGLGLSSILSDTLGAAYKSLGKRLHSYPNHPAYIRTRQRSSNWLQVKEAGTFSPARGKNSTVEGFGGKRCAVFMYVGEAMNLEDAKNLISGGSSESV